MDLPEILKDIPLWVPYTLVGGIMVAETVRYGMALYKNTKKTNAHFKQLQDGYKKDFSKEELMTFYEELSDVRSRLVSKKLDAAKKIENDLEKQIMVYVSQETKDALTNGTVLDWNNPIINCSPTYKKAIDIKSKRISNSS